MTALFDLKDTASAHRLSQYLRPNLLFRTGLPVGIDGVPADTASDAGSFGSIQAHTAHET